MSLDVYEPIPKYSGRICFTIFTLGTTAMILGVVAENIRTEQDNIPYKIGPDGEFVCLYPKSETLGFVTAACVIVLLGYGFTLLMSGFPFIGQYSWVSQYQRNAVTFAFFVSIVVLGCTLGLFVGSTVAELQHEPKSDDFIAVAAGPDADDPTAMVGTNENTGGPICRNGKTGLVGGAGIMAFCLAVIEIMYYELMLFAKGYYARLVIDEEPKGVSPIQGQRHSSMDDAPEDNFY